MNQAGVNHKTDYIVKMTEIQQRLARGGEVLIVAHLNPDGDAIGTQLAFAAYLRSLGAEPLLVCDDEIPGKYRFLGNVDEIVRTETLDADYHAKTALIIECPNPNRMGKAAAFISSETDLLNIDHHPDNTGFGSINWVNTSASSVGEMAFEFFQHTGFDLTPTVAEQLYTAILTDTGRFRFPSTSRRTMEIVGQLIQAGADPRKITDRLYYDMPPASLNLTGRVLSGMEFHYDGKLCLIYLTLEMLRESGCSPSDTEGLVDYTLYGRGVQAGALLRETDDGVTKVSLRSRDGIDVSAIAGTFGGGGHQAASGCTLSLPFDSTRQKILDVFGEVFGAA